MGLNLLARGSSIFLSSNLIFGVAILGDLFHAITWSKTLCDCAIWSKTKMYWGTFKRQQISTPSFVGGDQEIRLPLAALGHQNIKYVSNSVACTHH